MVLNSHKRYYCSKRLVKIYSLETFVLNDQNAHIGGITLAATNYAKKSISKIQRCDRSGHRAVLGVSNIWVADHSSSAEAGISKLTELRIN